VINVLDSRFFRRNSGKIEYGPFSVSLIQIAFLECGQFQTRKLTDNQHAKPIGLLKTQVSCVKFQIFHSRYEVLVSQSLPNLQTMKQGRQMTNFHGVRAAGH